MTTETTPSNPLPRRTLRQRISLIVNRIMFGRILSGRIA